MQDFVVKLDPQHVDKEESVIPKLAAKVLIQVIHHFDF